jgi:hypothetical protein
MNRFLLPELMALVVKEQMPLLAAGGLLALFSKDPVLSSKTTIL